VRILLIEDDDALGGALRDHLGADGHAADLVRRLDDAETAALAVPYDLVLLDLNLPDGRGLDFLKAMRRRGDATPVIIATAMDQLSTRIDGLNAGADDYLVKPFDLVELSARVGAVARRYSGNPNPLLEAGDLSIDLAQRTVTVAGKPATLTAREWVILERLASRPGVYVSRPQLEEALFAFGAEVESNAVEVYVSRLRKKLGGGQIETARGLGYRLVR
jgi:two-component system OmpR family response regulator